VSRRHTIRIAVLVLAVGVSFQCSKDTVTEERLADEALTRAMGSLDYAGYRAARPLLLDCLARERRLGRTRREADVLLLLGESCGATASFDSARMFLELAEDRFRAAGERGGARSVTLSLVTLLRQTGREREAYSLCAEALRLSQVFRDTAGMQEVQVAMLPLCRALGEDVDEARILEDLTATAHDRTGNALLARAFLEAGITSRLRHRYDEGMLRFTRALTIAGRSGDSLLAASALMWLAVTSDASGKTREAFQQFGEAVGLALRLETAGRFRCELMMRIGNAYLRYRQPGEARRFFRAALPFAQRLGDRIAEGFLAIQMSRCDFEEGAADKALQAAESAHSLFSSVLFAPGQAYALMHAGDILERTEHIPQAIERYRAAVTQVESMAQDLPLDHPAAEAIVSVLPHAFDHPYARLAELYLQTEKYEEAFRIAERRNRRRILRLAGAHAPSAADPALQDLLTAIVRARNRRTGSEQLHRRILEGTLPAGDGDADRATAFFAAVRDYETLVARVARAAPLMEPLLRVGESTLKETQSRVPPGAAVLFSVPARRALYSFVVTRERVTVQLAAVNYDRLRAVAGELDARFCAVEAAADSIQTAVGIPDAALQETLRQLGQWFLRPVQEDIGGTGRIIAILPPEFPRVPLHALRAGLQPTSPYLAESKAVSYLPSASFLDPAGLPPGRVRDVAGVGFSADGAWDVEYELRDIRAFYKEARFLFLQQANLTALRRERAHLLHLAAAVRVDDLFPGNSCIVLSNGKTPPSGISVQLGEMAGLPPSSIVILSNLAVGSPSLQSVVPVFFRANGTRAVVTNPYVPMRKTKKAFSELLYTGLLGGASIADAMQVLQKEMIRTPEFSSPLVWGVFFLVGS
jgi:tetratricopeptide (TPR) repeat protein